MITVTDLSVRYETTMALEGVSFSTPAGRLLALTGASGAGKTTLLWSIAGLISPDAGTVAFEDETLGVEQVSLIPQGNALVSVLTAQENLTVPLLAAGVDPGEATERATAALERLGVEGQARQLVEQLSGGQRQRVAIARAIAARPRILLADEITSDLDARNRDLALEILRQEAERGVAVVFATHDPEAAAHCDARLHLIDGRVENPGTA
ncbi:putative ABC transport system ATP-binding protein [Stackebrandtia endophytica]|uniref:Putative ABC transport system ATP-binding protein n=1 Tax=Stackebrandtia endophytica TaxID=1496996 RepID=A0A543B169_9ACTN|nr:ATP-binding cassette domain-containing protein [Stackebrandtia endophytica]TQL78582.1 putative ABC transport system ATP-binding protein [Stackebrandtia endophytica]